MHLRTALAQRRDLLLVFGLAFVARIAVGVTRGGFSAPEVFEVHAIA